MDDVKDYVVHQRKRPLFHTVTETGNISWRDSPFSDICLTIEDCWDADGDARLSAALIKSRVLQMARLYRYQQSREER